MPIRPELRELYPEDWTDISQQVRFERAGGRCESCGRPHRQIVCCLPDGRWLALPAHVWMDGRGKPAPVPTLDAMLGLRATRVVLSCAHLDHDPRNRAPTNLACLCQRCHLAHDAHHHRLQRAITYRMRSAIGDLFTGLYAAMRYPVAGWPWNR